nr:DUF488 domain-containing protein [Nitrospirota bacterium]
MIIRTRSIGKAKPGDLATYRWGSLRAFEDGRLFGPSDPLLSVYKSGALSWREYEQRYLSEMEALYRRSPERFVELLRRTEVTLVCYEARPERCHRRLLADLMAKVAEEHGIQVVLDVE